MKVKLKSSHIWAVKPIEQDFPYVFYMCKNPADRYVLNYRGKKKLEVVKVKYTELDGN